MVDEKVLSIDIDSEVRVDSLFNGRLVCIQPNRGYRYSVDSILLADFSTIDENDVILDLGCGCGIVGLILLFCRQRRIKNITGLELQSELVALAKKNAELNGFSTKYSIVEGDLRAIRTLFPAESFSRIVCNPPFYASSSGRKSIDKQSLVARHQVCSTTEQVMSAASYAVKNRGGVSLVFPAEGLAELFTSMEKIRLQTKRMRMVYSYPEKDANAKLVLIEAVKNGGPGIKVHQPLYIYTRKNGSYSEEMKDIYGL